MAETHDLRSDDDLLGEQCEFYRVEADDFDRWLTSLLDERNDDSTARHYRSARLAFQTELADRSPLGHVLEIAAGTGRLAELYLPFASSAVLLDTSAESLGLAGDRLRHSTPSPTFVEADIFAWDPAGQTFDTIIFSAWLHHVPHPRFDRFWSGVASLLADNGEVLFDYPDVNAGPRGVRDIPATPSEGYTFYEPRDGISIRDHAGRRWRVVHNLWDNDELRSRLAALGWKMTVMGTGLFPNILWASARR
jgi:SAM-dependent methyltransferase